MVDWNSPTESTDYKDVLDELRARDEALATMNFDSDSNIHTNSIRYNTTSKLLQSYNGSSWDNWSGYNPIQDGSLLFFTATGSSNAFVGSTTPSFTPVEGSFVWMKANHTSTGNVTLNLNGEGATDVKTPADRQIAPGQIQNGERYLLLRASSSWILVTSHKSPISYTPAYGANGSMTYTSVTIRNAKYLFTGDDEVLLWCSMNGTTGGTASTGLYFDLPVDAASSSNAIIIGQAIIRDATSGAHVQARCQIGSDSTICEIFKSDSSNWGIGANRSFFVTILYPRGD
jgi:hypothetical protein